MYTSVIVEGKFLELVGVGGGAFPFKVAESSGRKRSFIWLSFQEFCWLLVQMVRFSSAFQRENQENRSR